MKEPKNIQWNQNLFSVIQMKSSGVQWFQYFKFYNFLNQKPCKSSTNLFISCSKNNERRKYFEIYFDNGKYEK